MKMRQIAPSGRPRHERHDTFKRGLPTEVLGDQDDDDRDRSGDKRGHVDPAIISRIRRRASCSCRAVSRYVSDLELKNVVRLPPLR